MSVYSRAGSISEGLDSRAVKYIINPNRPFEVEKKKEVHF